MEFCPTCANMLQYELPHMSRPARLFCPTCPYVYNLYHKVEIKKKLHLVKKKIEPIISLDEMLTMPQTEERCDRCGHNKAYFSQVQIRSADEPMTTFYTCVKCRYTWRDDN